MKKTRHGKKPRGSDESLLDALIEEITVDAYGEDEQLWAFRQAFEDNIALPAGGSVMGESVTVIAFDYDGNPRRGLTAKCRTASGQEHVVAAADVTMPPDSDGGRHLGAYRKWMGLAPSAPVPVPKRGKPLSVPAMPSVDLTRPVELIVLSLTQKAAHCRLLQSGETVTLRAGRLWTVFPGEIAVVQPSKMWNYAGHPYLSGKIESTRLDVSALRLLPLRLENRGQWSPAEEYWGEEGAPIEKWAKPIIARGPRPQFEMEQVLPGADFEECYDPISEANDQKDSGDSEGAYRTLMDLCQSDLRCLDAHAHLGNLVFDQLPKEAIRHYEVGFRIGELSLGEGFDGALPWGWIDNRPFLRCMHGFGLCLWRLGRFEEAGYIFDRMLWLNPSDNQGVRILINDVQAKVTWKDSQER